MRISGESAFPGALTNVADNFKRQDNTQADVKPVIEAHVNLDKARLKLNEARSSFENARTHYDAVVQARRMQRAGPKGSTQALMDSVRSLSAKLRGSYMPTTSGNAVSAPPGNYPHYACQPYQQPAFKKKKMADAVWHAYSPRPVTLIYHSPSPLRALAGVGVMAAATVGLLSLGGIGLLGAAAAGFVGWSAYASHKNRSRPLFMYQNNSWSYGQHRGGWIHVPHHPALQRSNGDTPPYR